MESAFAIIKIPPPIGTDNTIRRLPLTVPTILKTILFKKVLTQK